jgi:2-polyprenyl-6-methoxyphenol hydroxylase-like FAD-dependent oxidoreductase
MLPFNAQGGNQALEDCGALSSLFSNLQSKDQVSERMGTFDQVRRKRANRQQIISSVPAEEAKNLGEKLKEYESEGPSSVEKAEDMRESILRELG